ncbi:MAG: lysophospholipid acyltransferase family protein [Alphaproteobacteria bacterium]|jgi:KDO2-lipid IV(A) lauroyltransferase|nr:lysophospholipid acyltransferase family protein [Alphaproteobacteria bacterium]MDP6563674.1 lysophospholipid acyltransferase family protein [Alphaproteobacteria bacterium]MDP6814915.1 lysophospholipid acyltransferase family protein [Alphaproteobacteria bacterium]
MTAATEDPKHPIRHRLEYYAVRALAALFTALPLAWASALGGWLGRCLGRLLPESGVAANNLRRALPDLDAPARRTIIIGVWENLGRTAAEVAHLPHFSLTDGWPTAGQIEVVGTENLEAALAAGKGTLLLGAHLANWELPAVACYLLQRPMHVIYRTANNPLIDQWIRDRRAFGNLTALPKGRAAGRGVLELLQRGETVGMLVDQKMNDGIPVPFFGRPAMTAPALAHLVLRQGATAVPVRCERLGGAGFRITYYPALQAIDSGDRQADVAALMGQVNALLESWIRERPEQWLWPHRRWPD